MIPMTRPRRFPAPGTRVRVTQSVRVGHHKWTTEMVGTIRDEAVRPIGGMEMGMKAACSKQPTVTLQGEDGEFCVIAVDENTEIQELS